MPAAGGRAAGWRLQGLCCAALVFLGALFLEFCDVSHFRKLHVSSMLDHFEIIFGLQQTNDWEDQRAEHPTTNPSIL